MSRFCRLILEPAAQCNAVSRQVDVDDAHADSIVDIDDFGGVGDVAVTEGRDVNEAVLVDTDVDESTEIRHVCDDAVEYHTDLEIFNFCDFVVEFRRFKDGTGIAAGFLEFLNDIVEGEQTDIVRDIFGDVDF